MNTSLILVLRENRLLKNQAEVSAFEAALSSLVAAPDPNDLPELFKIFTDATAQHEIMWGLLHFIESFGMERHLRAMIEALPFMLSDAMVWAEIFHCRVLNEVSYTAYYKTLTASQSAATKQAVENVLNKIANEDTDFVPRVNFILSK